MLIRVPSCLSIHSLLCPLILLVLSRAIEGIGLIVWLVLEVIIRHEGCIPLIMGYSSPVGAVDRNVVKVWSQSVSVSIRVREESSLKHLIIRWLNSRYEIRGGKG